MALDSLVANPGRLRILTALASDPQQDFVQLRQVTKLTDGNLATHGRRLQTAGFVQIDKSIRDGKPVTSFRLTRTGRDALEAHARELLAALGPTTAIADAPARSSAATAPTPAASEDEWVD